MDCVFGTIEKSLTWMYKPIDGNYTITNYSDYVKTFIPKYTPKIIPAIPPTTNPIKKPVAINLIPNSIPC